MRIGGYQGKYDMLRGMRMAIRELEVRVIAEEGYERTTGEIDEGKKMEDSLLTTPIQKEGVVRSGTPGKRF